MYFWGCRILAQPSCVWAGLVIHRCDAVVPPACACGAAEAWTVAHPKWEQLGCVHRPPSISVVETVPNFVSVMCSLCIILSSLATELLGFGFFGFLYSWRLQTFLKQERLKNRSPRHMASYAKRCLCNLPSSGRWNLVWRECNTFGFASDQKPSWFPIPKLHFRRYVILSAFFLLKFFEVSCLHPV